MHLVDIKKGKWYKMTPKEEEEFVKDFAEMLTEKWKKKGTVRDEEDTKYNIAEMVYLLSTYRFRCLIVTLAEVDEEFEKWCEERLVE